MFHSQVRPRRLRTVGWITVAATLGALIPSVRVYAQAHQTSPKSQLQATSQARRESPPIPAPISLAPGMVILVTLRTPLSSNVSSAGYTFIATVDDGNANEAYSRILRGAIMEGVVQAAIARQGVTPATLKLAFTSLRLSNGHVYPISGTVANPVNPDTQNTSRDIDLKPGTPLQVLLGDIAGKDGNGYHYPPSRDMQSGVGQAANTANNVKHYRYQGREWTMDLDSGRRSLVPVAY